MPPRSIDFSARMAAIGGVLKQTADFWRPAPFHHRVQPWAASHPGLHEAILGLSPDQVEAFHPDESSLRVWLDPHLPGLRELDALITLDRLIATPMTGTSVHAPDRDVPGRKWAQIEAFAGLALTARASASEVLDWCAGKAHLGRLIGLHSGLPVQALERDTTLCTEAERLAARDGIRLTFLVRDVLGLAHHNVLTPGTLACALHACGDLHLTLLEQAEACSPAGLLLAPCCYHRTKHEMHLPRSSAGQACGLQLTRDDLRLAVLETATAGHAQREAEKRRKARLLALKEWGLIHGLSISDYAPLRHLGRDDDVSALAQACEYLGWPMPNAGQIEELMETGWRRAAEVRAFELIRTAIRRPLEVWLVLDMALGLEEAGFAVDVGEFCDKSLTPRNLLIRARPPQGSQPPAGGQGS